MSLQSEDGMSGHATVGGSPGTEPLPAFVSNSSTVKPFEFRSLAPDYAQRPTMRWHSLDSDLNQHSVGNHPGSVEGSLHDRAVREAGIVSALEAARQQGMQAGEIEGRRAAQAEMEAETDMTLARERLQISETVRQFRAAADRYFADVEQEVVKLSLAIAGRILHREAQIDPLLLTGVVRVALEKMADRSGVVLRVAEGEAQAWESVFQSTEASERPRVAEDARLKRGECVLETRMGTVELGVQVQLEEIEKGFFDLLNHRPVE